MFREFYFSFRKNVVINILLILFNFFSLLLIFVLLRFSIQTSHYLSSINEDFEDIQIFHLSEETAEFIDGNWVEHIPIGIQGDGLERLKVFYYEKLLAEDNSFSITSNTDAMHLEIDVNDFPGGEVFQRHYAEGFNAGALPFDGRFFYQIQTKTVDYFGWNITPVDIEIGRGLQASDFGVFTGEPIPVVLGYGYLGYYNIGDIITGYYAAKEFDFEVIGILSREQSVFSRAVDYLVDHYIIIPFLSFCEPQNHMERSFQGFYYSLKALNTFIFVEDNADAINQMRNIVHTATDELGIKYFFSTMDRTFVRHNELDNLIHHNPRTINMLLISSIVLVGFINLILAKIKFSRQNMVFKTQMLLGKPKCKVMSFIILGNAILFATLILGVLYYAVFYSDIIIAREQLSFLSQHNVPRLSIFITYIRFDGFDYHHIALQLTALYGALLFVLSTSYPTFEINRLYERRSWK